MVRGREKEIVGATEAAVDRPSDLRQISYQTSQLLTFNTTEKEEKEEKEEKKSHLYKYYKYKIMSGKIQSDLHFSRGMIIAALSA